MTTTHAHRSRKIDILIAEDSPTQAALLSGLLEEQGHRVTVTSNGRQALAAMAANVPTLVISDVVMPDMDGYALCKAIKGDAALMGVPIILMTSLTSMQDIVKGLACGADNFIRKPYDPDALLARIDYILLNKELRKEKKTQVGVEIYLSGEKHFVTSDKEQILDLLVSSYEEAVKVNEELQLREQDISILNASLEERAAALEAANKELESFSYSISHDLRAPLRAIDGYSKILVEDHAHQLDEDGRRLLGVVSDNVAKMGQLIQDLLDFSRFGRQAIERMEIDMTRLVQQLFTELGQGHAAPVPQHVIEPLPAGTGDLSLLRQVWINLLSNAIKYSSAQDQPMIRVSGYDGGTECVYCVTDNGVGFDMNYYDRLFGVFQRLHSAKEFPGTGVGLAIASRIVTRHGGRIWAESKIGAGASFHFSLPK